MKLYITALLGLTLIVCIHSATAPLFYHKVVHKTDPEARCLDGSPAMIYVHEGGLSDHIMLFFLGGGICSQTTMEKTLESCYKRSKELLGSSTLWPIYLPPEITEGYLSLNHTQNAFANWTKFFIPYCDGSLHQGYTKDPIKYKDAQLYFRGGAITRSHIKWIDNKYNLKSAEKVFLTGMSAGGIAVNIWSNYVKDYVGDANKVYSVADSGIFNNFEAINGEKVTEQLMRNIYTVANVDEPTPNAQCTKHMAAGEQWKCTFVQYAYPYIQGRFMVINSEYDAFTIPNLLKIKCLTKGSSGQTLINCNQTQMNHIEKYRGSYRQTVQNFLSVDNELSVWSISCSQHVYACYKGFYDSPHQKIPTTTGKTVRDVIEAFVLRDERNVIIDEIAWPGNSGCAK